MARQSNIAIDQGTDVSFQLSVTDENGDVITMGGCSARAQLRKYFESTNSISFTAVCNTESETIDLSLTATQTANILAGRYVYDVDLTNAVNSVSRVVEGICTIRPGVTR